VPIRQADTLALICTACGGTMSKAISHTMAILIGAPNAASPSSTPRSGTTGRGHTCSDGVVKLTRSNPFAKDLPAHTPGRRESD
jgi:hypothetical protein